MQPARARRYRYDAALIGFERAAPLVVAARALCVRFAQALELIGIELHLADGQLALQWLGGDARFQRPRIRQRAGVDDADARNAPPRGLPACGTSGAFGSASQALSTTSEARSMVVSTLVVPAWELSVTRASFAAPSAISIGIVRGPTATALASICVRSAAVSCSPLPPASPDSTASEVATTASGVGAWMAMSPSFNSPLPDATETSAPGVEARPENSSDNDASAFLATGSAAPAGRLLDAACR